MHNFSSVSERQKGTSLLLQALSDRLFCQIDERVFHQGAVDSLVPSWQEIKLTASALIDQFEAQKKNSLERFDALLLPMAQVILDECLLESRKSLEAIDEKNFSSEEVNREFWKKEKERWKAQVSLWIDLEGLTRQVLEALADRSAKLIDKDIQIIRDYQTQSLFHFSVGSEAFKSLEIRLSHAVENPLKQLMSFKNLARERTSIEEVSSWIATLQQTRESYFDQLLMRIDQVVKELVDFDEMRSTSYLEEIESEVIFLERECDQVMESWGDISSMEDFDRQFLLARLEEIAQYSLELEKQVRSQSLKRRLYSIHDAVVSKLEGF